MKEKPHKNGKKKKKNYHTHMKKLKNHFTTIRIRIDSGRNYSG